MCVLCRPREHKKIQSIEGTLRLLNSKLSSSMMLWLPFLQVIQTKHLLPLARSQGSLFGSVHSNFSQSLEGSQSGYFFLFDIAIIFMARSPLCFSLLIFLRKPNYCITRKNIHISSLLHERDAFILFIYL
jgi:hypothetical protein